MHRVQRAFVDRMGHSAEADGMSPIAGRLFALLLLSDDPQSLDELADALEVSKASVSTDARRLLERGIVERVGRTGDRRDYYALAPDFFERIIRVRIERWRRMHALVADLGAAAPDLSATVRDRFASVDAIHAAVVDRVEEALDAWDKRA